MPNICGIIAEFNPFHNGHRAIIRSAREAGANTVVCVMSGNFVQRGSPAVTDKRVRAHAALECGADLIIELPLPCAVSTAQRFARGAVRLLAATGCVDMLAFGSESGDIESLSALSTAVDAPEVMENARLVLKDGLTFAKAREISVAKIYGGDMAAILRHPNNVLAVEYLRQARLQNWDITPVTVRRFGVGHHSGQPLDGYASASYLRENASDFLRLAEHVPEKAAKIYADAIKSGMFPSNPQKLETAILCHLRRLSPETLAALPDISEGLENRLYSSIRRTKTLNELEFSLKTKRYTMARIRRLILSAFLGLTAKDVDTLPPYIRILGFNENGRGLLKPMKERCGLPISTSLASLRDTGGMCGRFAVLEEQSTDLFGLILPSPLPCGYEYTREGVFLTK